MVDPFYRYKIPDLEVKIEGRGNGVRTYIENMVEISKSLERSPAFLLKFFSYELGAQTNIDEKVNRFTVNGNHSKTILQELIDKFMKLFVSCKVCQNPETVLVSKNKLLKQRCKACEMWHEDFKKSRMLPFKCYQQLRRVYFKNNMFKKKLFKLSRKMKADEILKETENYLKTLNAECLNKMCRNYLDDALDEHISRHDTPGKRQIKKWLIGFIDGINLDINYTIEFAKTEKNTRKTIFFWEY